MWWKSIWPMVSLTVREWIDDKAPRLGAALAFYSILSLGPLLLIVIAIASLVFGHESASSHILAQIRALIGEQGAQAIQTVLENPQEREAGFFATLIGAVTLLIGATGVFAQLQDALNTIWEVKAKPGRGLIWIIRRRFLSFAVVLGTGFLLLISLVIAAALAAMGDYYIAGIPEPLLAGIHFTVSFAVTTLLFAMIYKILPDVRIQWRDVWIGAVATAALFASGKSLIGFYLGHSDISTAYGASGSLVILLIWVYYSAQILFFGAEFTQVYARTHGSHIVPARGAIPLTEEARAAEGMTRDGLPYRDLLARFSRRFRDTVLSASTKMEKPNAK